MDEDKLLTMTNLTCFSNLRMLNDFKRKKVYSKNLNKFTYKNFIIRPYHSRVLIIFFFIGSLNNRNLFSHDSEAFLLGL